MSLAWQVFSWGWWALSYVLAYLFGVFTSVYVKRRFERWLDRPKLEISVKYVFKAADELPGVPLFGVGFTVTNRGAKTVEPFILQVTTRFGTFQVFEREDRGGGLGTDQNAQFALILMQGEKRSDAFAFVEQLTASFSSDCSDAVFSIVVDKTNGQRVLFQSNEMGQALMKLLAALWNDVGARQDAELLRPLRYKPESDLQHVRRYIRSHMKHDAAQWLNVGVRFLKARRWLQVTMCVVGLLGLCLLLGLLPLLITRNSEQAAQIGDSFGAASELITGLALLGAVYTIYLQHVELKSNEDTQARQLENQTKQLEIQSEQSRLQTIQVDLSQQVARIQALTFLSDFQYRLMKDAPPDSLPAMQSRVEMFSERAAKLLESLGERFDVEASRLIELPGVEDRATSELRALIGKLAEDMAIENDQRDNTLEAHHKVAVICARIIEWTEHYEKVFSFHVVGALRASAQFLLQKTEVRLFRPISDPAEMAKWKAHWLDLSSTLSVLRGQADETIRGIKEHKQS